MAVSVNDIRKDFFASVIIFLVALPLAIGISIACGLSVYCGIVSGIIGGIVVGSLSGNSLQVSGPAAGLILIIVDAITNLGIEKLFLMVFLCGIFQICFGFLSLGNWFRAISPAIIQGMLAGIGASIFLSQFHIMLDSKPQNTFLGNISDLISVIYNSVLPFDGSVHHLASMVGILTILIIILWNFIPNKTFKVIPSALVAVVCTSVFANFMHFNISYIDIGNDFFKNARFLNFDILKSILDLKVLTGALVMTFIASAETLLTSTAIDKMSSDSKTDYNKEITAQGIGNSIAGLVGALPITGVIVRSAANINAGAKTRLSAILHGVWILLFVTFFTNILSYIPSSALAAILVYTGYKLVDINAAKYIFKLSKGEFVIYLITFISILFTNLFEGILIGFGCALIKNVYKVLKVNIEYSFDESLNIVTAKIHGNITFIQLPTLIDALEKLPTDKKVVLCFDKLHFIDHACIDFIKDWENKRRQKDLEVEIDWNDIQERYPSFKWDFFHKTEKSDHSH